MPLLMVLQQNSTTTQGNSPMAYLALLTALAVCLSAYLNLANYLGRNILWQKKRMIEFHNVRILSGRDLFIKVVKELFGKAVEGDIIFGGCRRCTELDPVIPNLSRALSVAKAEIMIPIDEENREEARRFLSFGDNVELRKGELGNLRIVGIKNKEVILAFPSSTEYPGVHIENPKTAEYLYQAFSYEWERAKPVTLDNIDTV